MSSDVGPSGHWSGVVMWVAYDILYVWFKPSIAMTSSCATNAWYKPCWYGIYLEVHCKFLCSWVWSVLILCLIQRVWVAPICFYCAFLLLIHECVVCIWVVHATMYIYLASCIHGMLLMDKLFMLFCVCGPFIVQFKIWLGISYLFICNNGGFLEVIW